AVLAPGAATAVRRVAHCHSGATCHRDFLQLAVSEERDPPIVRGKERTLGVIGPRERRGMQLTEPSHVELRASTMTLLRGERDDGAMGREDRGRPVSEVPE